MAQRMMQLTDPEHTARLFGTLDCHLKLIEDAFGVTCQNRDTPETGGNVLLITGEEEQAQKALQVLEALGRMTDQRLATLLLCANNAAVYSIFHRQYYASYLIWSL